MSQMREHWQVSLAMSMAGLLGEDTRENCSAEAFCAGRW